MASWQMPPPPSTGLGEPRETPRRQTHRPPRGPATILQTKDLCDVEGYVREKGCSEFEDDEQLDVFCFAEDGRFAFCREFADWTLLWERGYLDF